MKLNFDVIFQNRDTLTQGREPGFSLVDNKDSTQLRTWTAYKDLRVNPAGERSDPLWCYSRARLDPRLSSRPRRCSPLHAASRQLLITPKEIPEYRLEFQTSFE